jgi:hypothetical protein
VTIPYSQDELLPDAATPPVADESSTERRRRIILHTAVGVGDLAGIEGKEITEIPRRRRWPFSPPTTTDGGPTFPRDRGDPIDIVNRYSSQMILARSAPEYSAATMTWR